MFKLRRTTSPLTDVEAPQVSDDDHVVTLPTADPGDDPRINAARHIIKNHVIAAMGLSLLPVPLVDLLVLIGLQLRMVGQLARLYGLPFYRGLGRRLIASLLGGLLPTGVALSAASLAKTVPGLGTTIGVISVSTLGGAATYAVGHTFLRHFATGGNLLSFDPDAMGDYFQAQFREAKGVVRHLDDGKKDHNSAS